MSKEPSKERPGKGRSIIAFPDEYVVIDLETTGLSPDFDSIIEISGIRFSSGIEVERYSSLVNAGDVFVDDFIYKLTGISQDMIDSAPPIEQVLPEFKSFIGDSILVGHNVAFDINFLYDNFQRYLNCPITNDFVNTVRIFRRLHPDAKSSKLKAVSVFYEINNAGEHRACRDCEITQQSYEKMKKEIAEHYANYEDFCVLFNKNANGPRVADFSATVENINPDNPLYGKVCVFTGALDTMVRREAMQLVVNHGGINADSVTLKTNYLILGNNDYCKSIKDGKSSKQKKAEKLMLEGSDIQIITESTFLDMLEE